ncbi:cytochrome P450 4V2-like, partial [Ornithodoros turicata]|uniref:cytochrome P450 4V2-like n=1 Tax=Ornithodoros turicata TaxID=34597 RepID=UPI003138665D
IFKVYAGWKPVVFLTTPEAAECLLGSSKNLKKSVVYDNLHPWLGADGLLTSHGGTWRVHRKLLTPAFHFRVLDNFLPTMNEQADVLIRKLETFTASEKINLFPLASKCALDVICETAMGVKVHAQATAEGVPGYARDIEVATRLFIKRCLRPWAWMDMVYQLTKDGVTSSKLMRRLHDFTNSVVERKMRNMEDCSPRTGKGGVRLAFLDLLTSHHRKGALSIEDVRQEVDTFMFAGHDTAAQTFTWAIYALGLHPEIERRVHDEIDTVVGDDEHITTAHLKQMQLLDCVLKETMRVFTIVPWVGRYISKDTVVGKYVVPKGSTCHVYIYGIHHSADHYPNPDQFDPDRFLPESCSKRHPFAFLPFSAGPRNCIGQKFALMEVKVLLAKFLRHFEVESCEHPDKLLFYGDLLLRSKKAIKVKITKRPNVR